VKQNKAQTNLDPYLFPYQMKDEPQKVLEMLDLLLPTKIEDEGPDLALRTSVSRCLGYSSQGFRTNWTVLGRSLGQN
jgi:hypothetical protein